VTAAPLERCRHPTGHDVAPCAAVGLSAAGLALPGGDRAAGENLAQEVAAIEQKHAAISASPFSTPRRWRTSNIAAQNVSRCAAHINFIGGARVDRREESLARRVTYSRRELVILRSRRSMSATA